MIAVSQIGWSHYHSFEGPFFGGDFTTLKVPQADRGDSFAKKVLAVTAAAEGGSWSSINMYDSGQLSVGAMQFIDVAPQFGVCDMLGEVAEKCGVFELNQALLPAMSSRNVMFFKTGAGKWRFSLGGKTVDSTALQHELYFGDAQGNALGSFTDDKKLIAKTWAACMANVWYIPGAVEAQSSYCLRRLMADFTWGSLRAELFNANVSDDGWLGATRAMLLSYAVNAPAIVVKQYDVVRSNASEKLSPDWCLEVLHGVVVNGGVDVWRARWAANMPVVERAFGVKLPTYAQLVARSWVVNEPPPHVEPEPTPEPAVEDVVVAPVVHIEPIVPEPIPQPPTPIVAPGPSVFDLVFAFFKMIAGVVSGALGRR
jgi:hypothetical protein